MQCPRCSGSGFIPDPRHQGSRARALRREAALSLREIARRMDLSAGYISDLELGRRGWNDELMKRYIKALQ